jgi:hypothetical protein
MATKPVTEAIGIATALASSLGFEGQMKWADAMA